MADRLTRWGLVALFVAASAVAAPDGGLAPESPNPFCTGDYADDFGALSLKSREFEAQPQAPYTFCVRTTATYECPSYGADGNLRRTRKKAVAHGTAFAYRQQNGETLLLTNQHVADWPAVTDDDHPVDDVPSGCKRVSDGLKIVDNENDAYEPDDIPLTRLVTDPQLDIAVLKAKTTLAVMPWKVGRSAGLRERNVVDVRGFPLGAFKATNVGKVISAYDHDDYKDWDHDDFVIDALLSPGNSGSPVFAISCKTGEFELVGIYHAGYTRGSALNVVVGIDQVRDLMTTLKRTPRAHADAQQLDSSTRSQLQAELKTFYEPFYPFGSLAAAVRSHPDGSLYFELLTREFPFKSHAMMVIEDLPPQTPDSFGELGRVWFGNAQGLKAYVRSELDSDTQAQVLKILDGLRHDALTSFAFRTANRSADSSREKFEQTSRLERAVRRAAAARQDLSQTASDLADRLSPLVTDTALTLADVMTPPPPAPPPPNPPALAASPSATLPGHTAEALKTAHP